MNLPTVPQPERAQRVGMHYEIEVHGLKRRIEIPFVTGVIADLSGRPVGPPPALADRPFVEIDGGCFDAFMAGAGARATFQVPNVLSGDGNLGVDLRFRSLDDFRPERLAYQIDALRALLDARSGVGADVARDLDLRLDGQLNLIIHHEQVQRLEATWRALHRLVNLGESDDSVRIKVLNVSKVELATMLRRYKGSAWDQSPLFRRLYGEGYGSAGGDPFGCIVLDFAFDHSPPDVQTLGELAKIGAAIHAPLLAAASPAVMQMQSWLELPRPRDLRKLHETAEYAPWRALRQSEDARYLGLTLPGFLVRAPYVPDPSRNASYRFREDTADGDPRRFVWASSAFLLALNINRSFRIHGWSTHICGLQAGGVVEGLAQVELTSFDGGPRGSRSTEVMIDDRRDSELAQLGFIALVWRPDSDIAVFERAHSLNRPFEYDDPKATANAQWAAHLPYLLAVNRVAHYLRAIVRDVTGSSDRAAMQAYLERWIADYVDPDPAMPDGFAACARPFSAAEVRVEEVPGEPGHFTSKFFVRPHA